MRRCLTCRSGAAVVLAVLVVGLSLCVRAPARAEAGIPAEKQFVLDWLDRPEVRARFAAISDAIWSYAEVGLEEYKSAELLATTLSRAGFRVQLGVAGMPTAIVASYGTGKPVIAIHGEYDALPGLSQKAGVSRQEALVPGGPGHGCTHNVMGAAGAAAAIAVREAMAKYGLPGTIRFYGCPAEEILISRAYTVRAGLYDDVDAVIDNHGGSSFGSAYGVTGRAMYNVVFTFIKGRTAHGTRAWEGRSALDAVQLMNLGVEHLREHLHPDHSMHYVITDGGMAPNIVPDRAQVWYFIRHDDKNLRETFQKVVDIARAAAAMTQTEVEIWVHSGVHQSYRNKVLAELFQENIELVGMPQWTDEEQEFARAVQAAMGKPATGMRTEVSKISPPPVPGTPLGGSTDVGEVTLVTPTAGITFPVTAPGLPGHTWGEVVFSVGSIAHKGLIAGAKAMAASAIDLLTRPEVLQAAREEFRTLPPYESYLPADARPPLGWYKEYMQKYRQLLAEFYLEPVP